MQHAREAGRDAFVDVALPHAVLALKQGVGRLIRDVGDRGVVAICDPRLIDRGYGTLFLNSLPPMPRTTDPAPAIDLLNEISRTWPAAPAVVGERTELAADYRAAPSWGEAQ